MLPIEFICSHGLIISVDDLELYSHGWKLRDLQFLGTKSSSSSGRSGREDNVSKVLGLCLVCHVVDG